jgi:hypothetical protein
MAETSLPDLAPYIEMLQSLPAPEQAAQIMRAYSDVLATLDLNAPVFDARLLPHGKDDIRKAFVYGFIVAQDDDKRKTHLQQGYVLLGRFQVLERGIEDVEAAIAADIKALSEEVVVWDILIARMQQQTRTPQ